MMINMVLQLLLLRFMNALELQQKKLSDVKIVCIGAGAAGIASMRLLVALGADKKNMFLLDTKGVIHLDEKI